ncbi:DUF305 domain-containing protein [Nocardiopsis sp. MG754419]|uniref:DUF305 domain-containing protein n=1 Tax=Nocardiopsis sp. MG754419 TaxID=2259865 RepID=UPI001BABF09A|nr:DUF305 domain-containing protein [Nocardiopsis sp. MG754419]MBR8740518.1 DUF305 domain-containing protein [Nocardiopsis sp. MG754419]
MGHVTGADSGDGGDAETGGHEDDGAPPAGFSGATAQADPTPRARRSTPLWMTVILVALALAAGFLLGRPSYPLDTGADAGFLRDMSAHHAQAVDMSMVILDKTEDVELHTIATDMARTQQAQIGMMQGWLAVWGLSARASEPPMTWMEGHDHGGGEGEVPEDMPGLATSEQLVELDDAEGEEAEVLFLELMIAHHLGGIEMAEAEVELGREDLVVDFAQGMVDAQLSEVENMERLLEMRG